jgi:hypothetical protein
MNQARFALRVRTRALCVPSFETFPRPGGRICSSLNPQHATGRLHRARYLGMAEGPLSIGLKLLKDVIRKPIIPARRFLCAPD